jgi:glucose/arabinose dehydrogenase
MHRSLPPARLLAAGLLTAGFVAAAPAQAQRFETQRGAVQVDSVASGLRGPWALEFLPDGRMLVTEKAGNLRIIEKDGTLGAPIAGVPRVDASRQGGLLDVALDPAFASNRTLYWSYAEPREGGNGTSVARGRLNAAGTALEDVRVIFRQTPTGTGGFHFGSRLVFDRSGALFVTVGDRFGWRDRAQEPGNHIGKVIRIRPDGSAPADNPQKAGWAREVWSIGHRNVQGADLHPSTGQLWTAEHGARGGDEINIPQAGNNYGWPVITYGRDYSGARIGEGTAKPGLEQPVFYWDPSIAPAGMTFYTASQLPGWQGNLFVGALAGQIVSRLTLDGNKVVAEERLFNGLDRIRDVKQGPDGLLYLVAENAGAILRVKPAS